MKKQIIKLISVVTIIIMLSLTGISAAPAKSMAGAEDLQIPAPKSEKVLEARFLNMLNHNYNYSDDFYLIENIINNSVIAKLDLRDSEDDSFISENYIADYIFDMYGIEVEDFSQVNSDFPKKQGYIYIIPRGYSEYEHSFVSAQKNEDGSYSVTTKITEYSHDSGEIVGTCKTLFVPNTESIYGFNIINSDIIDNSQEI